MSKRMTDERMAEIEAVAEINDGYPDAFSGELLQALKAEREHIVELKATEGYQQMLIEELEAGCDRLHGYIKDKDKQLAAVSALPDKWDQEDTGYYAEMRQCAAELREALAGGEDGSK